MTFVPTPWRTLHLALDLAIVLLQVLAIAWALRRRPRTAARTLRAELPVVVLAAAAAAAAWLPCVLLLGGILGFSLLARVAWTTCTVSVPLVALWAAGRHRAVWPAALAALLIGAKYYGEVWEPGRLEVERLEVPVAGLSAPVKMVHLSDLQTDSFGPLQESVRAQANAFDPDLVVFTGDVINHPSLAGPCADYLAGFKARAGKFFVSGDVDGGYDWRGMLERAGFTFLDGRAMDVRVGPARLGLLGVSVEGAFDRALILRLARQARAPRLLLTHRPDGVFAAADAGVALVLAGHTHGGQVCLPFFGPVVTLTRVARSIAAGGLHRFGPAWIEVSRGLGWEGHVAPRVRAFCRPQLVLLTLRPAPPGAARAVAR